MPARKFLAQLFIFLILLPGIPGCQAGAPPAAPAPTDTPLPTVDQPATQAAAQTAQALAAVQTQQAVETSAAIETLSATATQAAAERQATLIAGSLQTRAAPSTQLARTVQTATAVAASTFAAQESQFRSEVLGRLFDDQVITSTEGEYRRLNDVEKNHAKTTGFLVNRSPLSPENFVISADVAWDVALDKIDWRRSRCGFVYAERSGYNLSLATLSMDGAVTLLQVTGGKRHALRYEKAGQLEVPSGAARLVLSVQDRNVAFYFNGRLIYSSHDSNAVAGRLGYTVWSGTAEGYGTRCTFSNIEVFIFR